jgi:hypothetical protein
VVSTATRDRPNGALAPLLDVRPPRLHRAVELDRRPLHCPCHGSVCDRHGEHIAGPAPRALDLMQFSVDNGKVAVNTGQIARRRVWRPSQSVELPGFNSPA